LTVVDGCGADFDERATWARWLAVRTDIRTALKWAAVDDVALRDALAMTPTSDASLPRGRRTIGRYVRALNALLTTNPGEEAISDRVHWL
jgi:hypothetical protein